MEMPTDGVNQSRLAGQHVHHSNTAVVNGFRSFGDFVLDVGRRNDWLLKTIDELVSIQPSLDAPLALFDNLW